MTKTYDDASRLLTLNNANSALTYAYDFAGQLTGETQNVSGLGAKVVGYTYDGDGNRLNLTYPGGKVAAYSYTGRNQVDTITYDGPPPLVNYDYDLAGNRTVKTLENSTRAVSTYDDASRLTALDAQRSSGGVWTSLQSFAYTLNSVGNRTDRYETNAGLTKRDKYSYLADDQLDIVKYNYTGTTQDRTVDYNYDAAGNRTAVSDSAGQSIATYTTNNLNQYASMGGQTEYYDSNGNIGYGPGTGSLIYNHDAQNRLTGTQGGSGNVSVSYDARNRCVKRVAPFTTGSGSTTTYLVWDGWSLLAEYTTASGYNGTGYVNQPLAEARRYVHGARVDEILLAIAPTAAQTVHHVHDALGNVTALTDASGTVVERYTYDVFGKTTILNASGTVLSASAYGNRFMFTGREWIAELNVYDYRNRMYAPGMGRFLETDPINYAAGDVNIYRYVGNHSVNSNDPFGLLDLGTGVPGADGLDCLTKKLLGCPCDGDDGGGNNPPPNNPPPANPPPANPPPPPFRKAPGGGGGGGGGGNGPGGTDIPWNDFGLRTAQMLFGNTNWWKTNSLSNPADAAAFKADMNRGLNAAEGMNKLGLAVGALTGSVALRTLGNAAADFGLHEAAMAGATGVGAQAGASYGISSFREYLNSH